MNIEFFGRHFRLRQDIKDLAERKLHKVGTFLEEPADARITLEAEKRRRIADIHVTHRFGVLQATEESESMEDALQAAVDKVEKQARRARKKFLDNRRRADRAVGGEDHWPVDVLESESVGSGQAPRIIKTNRLAIKPMTLDEAALQLAGSKNEFFVFLDSATERVSVLYRRRDQNYGLIAPEF